MSEVHGLKLFAEYMRGLEDCYTVIGGTACNIILSDAELSFKMGIPLALEEALDLIRRVYGL